jgi:hypothetical protein
MSRPISGQDSVLRGVATLGSSSPMLIHKFDNLL